MSVETCLLLFQSVKVNTVTFGKSDGGFLVSDDENVRFSGGESLALGVSQVDNIETTQMSFDVLDGGNSTDVVSTSDIGEMSGFVGVPFQDLVLFKVVSEGISFVDFGVGESDGSAVVGDDVGSFVGTNKFALDFHELDFSFSIFYFNGFESSLDVVEKSEMFVGLGDGDDIHDTDGELVVPSDFVIDLDAVFFVLKNKSDFTAGNGVVKVIST